MSGTSADAVSGVSSSTFHVGAVNACATGAVIGPTWDTTTSPNGTYQVCNVIIDNAGHQAVVATTVTVANPWPLRAAPATAPAGTALLAVTPPVIVNPISDPVAPRPPTKVGFILPRAKAVTGTVSVRLRWVKPTASDLARIVVVLNLERPPRHPADGAIVYRGLGTPTSLRLKVGDTGYVALFAYDRSGNVSSPARKVVSLAPLIPLRPTTGSSVSTAPRLTWKAQAGERSTTTSRSSATARACSRAGRRGRVQHPEGQAPARHIRLVRVAGRQARKPAPVRQADRARDVRLPRALVDVQLVEERKGIVDALEEILVVLDHLAAHVDAKPLLVHEQLVAVLHLPH